MSEVDDTLTNSEEVEHPRHFDRRGFVRRAAEISVAAAGVSATGGVLTRASSAAQSLERRPSQGVAKPTTLTLQATTISSLDPSFFSGNDDLAVMANVYEGLVTYKPGNKFEVVPTLAEDFSVSRDGRRFAFKLKRGVHFHGGFGELTAADVKYSYERTAGLTSPPIKSPYAQSFLGLERVKTSGKYSGTLIFKEPFAPLLRVTLPVVGGLIVSKKAVEQRGADYSTHPIGTGPYQFVSYTPNASVQLKRFGDYGESSSGYAARPQWNEIVFAIVPTPAAAAIALQSGNLDFGAIALSDISQFTSDSRFKVTARQTLGYDWIGMNVNSPQLQNLAVRKAIRLAIDVPAILQGAYDGRYARARGVISPAMGVGYWGKAPKYNRDVAGAKALLAGAGVSNLRLTFTYNTVTVGAPQVAQIVQANLADIGITVTLRPQSPATFFANNKDELNQRELFHVHFETQPDPSRDMQWWTCDQAYIWNWMFFCDHKFDQLAVQALRELNPKKRNALYISMQQLWDQNANAIWLAWPTAWFGYKKSLQPALLPNGRAIAWAFRSS
jgi:peptide/nickel transport system substrate-binding protein